MTKIAHCSFLEQRGQTMEQDDKKRRALMRTALHTAAKYTEEGTIKALAKHLGVSTQMLHRCTSKGKFTPHLAKKIDDLTQGRVPRNHLNPDVFG